jgi:hypothetical protein
LTKKIDFHQGIKNNEENFIMEKYLTFIIQSSHSINEFRNIPEVRNKIKDKILHETLSRPGGIVYDIEEETEKTLNYVEKQLHVGRQ